MMRSALTCALAATIGIASCSSVDTEKPRTEKPRQIRVGAITYLLDPAYTRLGLPQSKALVPEASAVYTIDGFSLDLLTIHASIREGRALGTRPFSAAMSPNEIADAYGALLTKEGFIGSYRIGKIEKATFAGAPGFRYEFSLVRRGLAMTGLGYGAVIDKKLYHVAYLAPMKYSFEKNLPLAEATAKSFQVRRSAKESARAAPEEELE